MDFNYGKPSKHSHDSPDFEMWSPDDVLGLTNKKISSYSCIGWAKTRGRRCERWIAQRKTMYGHNILHKLACDSPSKAAESPRLHDAADILLCWQHAGQISDILSQWRRKLENCADDIESKDKSRVKMEPLEDRWLKQLQEDLARLYAAGKTVPPRNIKREEEERVAQEKVRRKQEKQMQKETKTQRKEEERMREQKAREGASCQRARLTKETREGEAREKAEKEPASWRAPCEREPKAWNKPADVSVTSIPWPVESGLQSDVNDANVKLFFAKAPPTDLVGLGDKCFKLISEENMRWHTDKLMQRFGSDAVNGSAKGSLVTVAKVVIEFRQEPRRGRST